MKRLVLGAFLLAGCAGGSDETLVFTIEQALATSPNGAVLGRSVSGGWDRMCIFRPNTAPAVIDSVIGRPWREAESDFSADDAHTLLVFATGERVDRWVLYPRAKGDFTPPEGRHCVARDDAVFQVRQPIDGSIPWVGPVNAGAPDENGG